MYLTIDQIHCLEAISEMGSLTAASAKLFKAKSAINYSIKSLEDQLGFELLDKSSYRVRLTPKAEEFLYRSKNLLSEYESLLQSTKQIRSGIEVKLSISGSGVCSLDRLYSTIKSAMDKFPNTEITLIREILSGEKLLETQEVDLALFENLTNKQDYDYIKLNDFQLPLVMKSDHSFLKLPKIEQTLDRLNRIPHIIQKSTLEYSSDTRSVIKDGLNWTVTDTLSKLELISSGLGWGRLPSHLISKDLAKKKLVHIEHLDKVPKLTAYLCRSKYKVHGEVSNFIWDSFN